MALQTSARFLTCMPFVLQEEGPTYSNDPDDHGHGTRYGIIQTEYNVYRHSNGLPLQSVNLISADEYNEIYWQSYWQPHCPALPNGLDLSVFNINVNGGSGRGTRLLQQCLGLEIDGVWGPKTNAAVAVIDNVTAVIEMFHADERVFYQAIINHNRSQQKFASDWFRPQRSLRGAIAEDGSRGGNVMNWKLILSILSSVNAGLITGAALFNPLVGQDVSLKIISVLGLCQIIVSAISSKIFRPGTIP